MPAAAVIPAPIAYIKVVAVKKLVVGFRGDTVFRVRMFCLFPGLPPSGGGQGAAHAYARVRAFSA